MYGHGAFPVQCADEFDGCFQRRFHRGTPRLNFRGDVLLACIAVQSLPADQPIQIGLESHLVAAFPFVLTDRPEHVLRHERAQLEERLERLQGVEMAVIVSPGQNEVEAMNKLGLDILPHRKRMNESQPQLDERFKDPHDPLRLVFVCAMWLTGFDAPSCSTIYLDKPMRNHTLMQTITRANRVYPGKHSGVIVDYANVFASLEKALAIYATRGTTKSPIENKDELVEDLRAALAELATFCGGVGVNLDLLESSKTASERLHLFGLAKSALIAPDELRKAFLAQVMLADRLYASLKPHKRSLEFVERMSTVTTLAADIRATVDPHKADLSHVLQRIGQVLDESIQGAVIPRDGPAPINLSRVDFEALKRRFTESATKSLDVERLKAAIRARLDRLIEQNETRIDFREKFEALIAEYNAGSRQIEQLFQDLLDLTQTLTDEEARHVREQLSEEELVVFDLLTRPGPELSTKERDEVKKVAREMLDRLGRAFTVDWQKTAQSRARVKDAIEETLDAGLPRAYTNELFKEKAGVVFEHVYRRYGRAA